MSEIRDVISKHLEDLPSRFLQDLIARKLTATGIEFPAKVPEELADQILSGQTGSYFWDDGKTSIDDIDISITDDDLSDVEERVKNFIEQHIPSIIEKTADDAASDLLASLKKKWDDQLLWERSVTFDFRDNLQIRWAKGLNLLRMLVTISLELGAENLKRHKRSKRRKNSHLSNTLIRLHARACQVTAEILVLMESGFSDGATARWRTLHEIGVVATFISQFGEDTAERYSAHQVVDAKALMDDYNRSSNLLGYKPINGRSAHRISKEYDEAIKQHGKEFGSQYGWAAKDLNKRKPIFSDLEAEVGQALTRANYRFASHNVHATPQGIHFRLGLIDPGGILAGASNAGLTEPGQNTAASLTLINTLLFGPRWKFEDIVTLKVLKKINDELPNSFLRAERKLNRYDAAYRKKKVRTA